MLIYEGRIVSRTEKLSQEENQRIMGISAMLTLPILLGGAFYVVIYLHAITNLIDINQAIMYLFLLVAPISTGFCFAIYEVLFSRKIDKTILSHLKRFLSRMIIVSSYFFSVVIIWTVFNFLLSALISWRYILLLTLLASSLTLVILVAIPKTRQIIEKFTKEDNL